MLLSDPGQQLSIPDKDVLEGIAWSGYFSV